MLTIVMGGMSYGTSATQRPLWDQQRPFKPKKPNPILSIPIGSPAGTWRSKLTLQCFLWKSRDLPLTKKTKALLRVYAYYTNSSNFRGYLLPTFLLTPIVFLVPLVLPRFSPNFRWFKTHGRTTTVWCLNPNSLICEHICDISNLHFSMIASESLRCFKLQIFHGFTIIRPLNRICFKIVPTKSVLHRDFWHLAHQIEQWRRGGPRCGLVLTWTKMCC